MTEKQTLMYENEEYDVSDLDEKEAYWHLQVKVLRKRIADARFDLDQMIAAEHAFANTLINSLTKENTDESDETTD